MAYGEYCNKFWFSTYSQEPIYDGNRGFILLYRCITYNMVEVENTSGFGIHHFIVKTFSAMS